VTGYTRSGDTIMGKCGWYPRRGRVAEIALGIGGNVSRPFSCGADPVVATVAAAENLGMVDIDQEPAGIQVTAFADVGGCDMCRAFARGTGTVVTGETRLSSGCMGE